MEEKYKQIFNEFHMQNSVKIDALVQLFINKGIITENEYIDMKIEIQQALFCCITGKEQLEELGLSPESE